MNPPMDICIQMSYNLYWIWLVGLEGSVPGFLSPPLPYVVDLSLKRGNKCSKCNKQYERNSIHF